MKPCELPAAEMLESYACRALSPLEVMHSLIDRVGEGEPHLHACWALDFDSALEQAAASEARWAKGVPVGKLDGIPVSVKEMIATRGVPRPLGTAAGDMTPAAADAPPAARVREAGAIIWGKTTNPDFGMLSSGLSSFHALARNPWHLARTPGGSSAGAGAAAAAGYGPLHLGTDIGGSLRLPAGWCGIFSLKPSAGRVPIHPPFVGRVAGPMTRTVADSALLMEALTRPDARDYTSLPFEQINWAACEMPLKNVRIALMTEAGCGSSASAEVIAAIEQAAHALAAVGARIERVAPFLTQDMLDGLDLFWRARFLDDTKGLPSERYQTILPYIRAWGEGARGASGAEVYRGFSQIVEMQELGNTHFDGFDFLISPVTPETAFPADWASPGNDPARPFEHIGFTVAYNMTGQPAASVNCGYDASGLPIGLQIVGRRFDDLGVLRLARTWEAIRPDQKPWPAPWTGHSNGNDQ